MEAKPATLPSASTTRVYTWNEDEDPYKLLAKALKESGITTGKIGIEERTQFVFADGIAHASPALTATSATPITYGCRSIKSPAELALMQLANNITLSVYKACLRIRPTRHDQPPVLPARRRSPTPAAASPATPAAR